MIRRILSSANRRVNLVIKPVYFNIYSFKVECNICQWRDNQFEGDNWHPNTICPKCRSQVRQRLFWAGIDHLQEVSTNNILRNKRTLHFAPDKCLTDKLSEESTQYTTADLLQEGYDYDNLDLNLDISNMHQLEDQAFECVIALDVLEHVRNHFKAIEETNRILSLGGYCIFTVPQKDNLESTYEDLSITDPEEREKKFGQWDHWRIYGNDFKEMIENKGFDVTIISEQDIDNQLVKKHVLFPPVLSNHPLATNYRRLYFGRKIKHIT